MPDNSDIQSLVTYPLFWIMYWTIFVASFLIVFFFLLACVDSMGEWVWEAKRDKGTTPAVVTGTVCGPVAAFCGTGWGVMAYIFMLRHGICLPLVFIVGIPTIITCLAYLNSIRYNFKEKPEPRLFDHYTGCYY